MYHLVNYSMNTARYSNYYGGTVAGTYWTVNVDFGCVAPQTFDLTVPIPAAFAGRSGTAKVISLDYEAPAGHGSHYYTFFPNSGATADSPCWQEPLGGEFPSEGNNWAYPQQAQGFPSGATTVTIPAVKMKQWMIVSFE
jgi:hypothetical protein